MGAREKDKFSQNQNQWSDPNEVQRPKVFPFKSLEGLRQKPEPRKNWDLAFKNMHKNGDDQLNIDDVFEDETFE